MGLKYTPDECSVKSDLLNDEALSGQLQVHIVEGAGFVDEESRKPFNTFVKWYVTIPEPSPSFIIYSCYYKCSGCCTNHLHSNLLFY